VPFSSQLSEGWPFIVASLLLVLLTDLFHLLASRNPSLQIWIILSFLLDSICLFLVLLLNILALAFSPTKDVFLYLQIPLLVITSLINGVFTAVFHQGISALDMKWKISVLFLSTLGLSTKLPIFFNQPLPYQVRIENDLHRFILTGFFIAAPFSVFKAIQSTSSPSIWLVAVFIYNISFLVGLFLRIVLDWNLNSTSSHGDLNSQPLLNESEDVYDAKEGHEEEREAEPEPEKGSKGSKMLTAILLASSPLFALSLVPHFLSLVGIPLAKKSFQRFWQIVRLSNSGSSLGGRQFGEESRSFGPERGFFLLPLNLVCLVLLLILMGPFLLATAFAFAFASLLLPSARTLFSDLQTSFVLFVSALWVCYFPFVSSLPQKTRPGNPSGKLLFLGGIWFLCFEIGLPLWDVISDLLFSLNLYSLTQDPHLEKREDLLSWTILSFFACGLGLLLEVAKWVVQGRILRQALLNQTLHYFVYSHSPFGTPATLVPTFLKGAASLFEDTLQIVVSVYTLSFLGSANFLWGAKLLIALISCSFGLSKVMTVFLMGLDSPKAPRFVAQTSFFFMFGLVLVSGLFFQFEDNFCSLSRSVMHTSTLKSLEACQSFPAYVKIHLNSEKPVEKAFEVSEHSGTFLVEGNEASSLNLTFGEIQTMEGTFNITKNMGQVSVDFPKLTTIKRGSEISVEWNPLLFQLSFPSLFIVEKGSSLRISHCEGMAKFFLGMTHLEGSLELVSLNVTHIELPHLFLVLGDLTLYNNTVTYISLDSVTMIEGNLEIVKNSVENLVFSSVFDVSGEIKVLDNPYLKTVFFPSVQENSKFNSEIAGNPLLEEIDLRSLKYFIGDLTISSNPSLKTVVLEYLRAFSNGRILIEANDALRTLDLSSLDCSARFNIILKHNPLLQEVYIPSKECLENFNEVGNPQIQFRIQ